MTKKLIIESELAQVTSVAQTITITSVKIRYCQNSCWTGSLNPETFFAQVVNVLREEHALRRGNPSASVTQTSHVRIPAVYQSGISLFCNVSNTRCYNELRSAPELPLLALNPAASCLNDHDDCHDFSHLLVSGDTWTSSSRNVLQCHQVFRSSAAAVKLWTQSKIQSAKPSRFNQRWNLKIGLFSLELLFFSVSAANYIFPLLTEHRVSLFVEFRIKQPSMKTVAGFCCGPNEVKALKEWSIPIKLH